MIKSKHYLYLLLCFNYLIVSKLNAQQIPAVSGSFFNKTTQKPLLGVVVTFINNNDSTYRKSNITDPDGHFSVTNLKEGSYQIRATYLGFKKFETRVYLTANKPDLGNFYLEELTNQLKDFVLQEKAIRSVQKGDTTEYNANAFKTNPDANVQDLVAKMPGITVENGVVKAQGENVQRITIDGREFFGDDVTLALKNLPAEVVDKIQVFDRQSDQAQFTGFNDGNTQKAINITTKSGKSEGMFGRLYAGGGTNDRYSAGGNLNIFNGKQRISILGLTNNINQQNFGSQDLIGLNTNNSQGRGGAGGGRGFGGGGMGPGMFGGNNNPAANFSVGNQGGINTSSSGGVNFSNVYGSKINFTGSYFFNQNSNNTQNNLQRISFLGGGLSQTFNQNSLALSDNVNHRLNLRFEYNIDSNNSVIITPKISFQNNTSNTSVNGFNLFSDTLLNTTINKNLAKNDAVNINNNILYRHKFLKQGRTISFNIGTDFSDKNGRANLNAQNRYLLPVDSSFNFDQQTITDGKNVTLSTQVFYTEQLTKNAMLMFNYSPQYNYNFNDKVNRGIDTINGEYSILNNSLSSNFENILTTQKGGVNYRLKLSEKANFMIGANYQNVILEGTQKAPAAVRVQKTFDNILPGAMFSYQFNKKSNVRIFYRTNTNAPSISQLQTVIDNSNPLILSSGNNNLIQEYSNVLVTRFGFSNPDKGKTFYFFMNANQTQNYIGNATFTARDSNVTINNVKLTPGAQFTRPENFDGFYSINSFITYGFPVKKLKSNLNLNLGTTYSRTPSKINNAINLANTYVLTSGFALGSNISEKIDFSVSYTAFYNIVENSLNARLNNNYFYQISSLKINLLPWKGLIFRSEVTNTYYTGLGNSFNQNFFLWSGGIGYKFLKNNAAELMLNTFDVLNQNNNISRTVAGNYIEDSRTQVLNRYFMLVFTYNLRSFKLNK